MLRSKEKLDNTQGPGGGPYGSNEARDILYHFFQDAFHLKDWIKNDTTVPMPDKAKLEAEAHKLVSLRMCADLCNGSKHLRVDHPKTTKYAAEATTQSATLHGSGGFSHSWSVEVPRDGKYSPIDARELADEVIAAWDDWLAKHRLNTT